MIADLADGRANKHRTSSLLTQLAVEFHHKPFVPARFLKQGDAQTFGAYLWPGRFRLRDVTGDEERLYEVEPGSLVLARCRWQPDRTQHPTLVMWHGLEGSATSAYMLSTAAKAFQRGFNVVRMNIRNCGGTEHLTPTLYHGGLTGDLRVVIAELIEQDRLPRIVIAGFSLGGNMTLKVAGEYGEDPPIELKGVVAISPSADLQASFEQLSRPRNLFYHQDFLIHLKRRIKLKARLHPGLYDSRNLGRIRSIEQFDERFVAPAFGFADARDYYAKASALPYISRIRVPTLIVHAQDDPFIPFSPLEKNLNPRTEPATSDMLVTANEHVLLVAPRRGGHVAFLSADSQGEDRFWAENRLVEFCTHAANAVLDS